MDHGPSMHFKFTIDYKTILFAAVGNYKGASWSAVWMQFYEAREVSAGGKE